MPSNPQTRSPLPAKRRVHLRFLLVAAAIWHISIVLTLFAVGKFQLAPARIYPNGIGAGFAIDTVHYQAQCVELSRILRTEGPVAWATWPTQLHLRFYSLPLAPVSRWITFNILTIEPVNLFYYLALLVLVFKIGERVFDYRSGLIAAGIVALWPSLLLHTTQLLRDPLLIVAVLFFIWCLVELLQRDLRLTRGLLLGIGSAAAVMMIRIVRQPFWYLIVAAAATAILLVAARAWRERRVMAGAVLFGFLLITAVVVTPRFQPYFLKQQELRLGRTSTKDDLQKMPLVAQIAASRGGFNSYYDDDGNVVPALDRSLIDTDIQVRSLGDVIRLVPRAIEVGLFAPFPNMWFQTGRQVGSSGRLLAGMETLITYMIECLALFGIWRARRSLSAWFLMVFVALGVVALGLAVNNVGTLYRLRYPFWILMVILGAGGIDLFRRTFLKAKPQVS
jgi:putative peptidoglycan lipid II flippase